MKALHDFAAELKKKGQNDNPIGLSQRKPLDGKKKKINMNNIGVFADAP